MTYHTLFRASERYGIDLTEAEVCQINGWLATGDRRVATLGKVKDGGRMVAIRVRDQWLPVVCGRNATVITVLPVNRLIPYRKDLSQYRRMCVIPKRTAAAMVDAEEFGGTQ